MDATLAQIKSNRLETKELFEKLLLLTKAEKQLFSDEFEQDAEALQKTLATWNETAQRIDEQNETYRRLVALVSARDPEGLTELRPELAGMETEFNNILETISHIQKECDALVNARIEDAKGKLKEVKKSNHRITSYVNPYPILEDGLYFDQKK